MNMVDSVLINTLHLITPFAIYLFYVAYKKTYDEKENELVLILTIFTALYICLKYNIRIIETLPLISINIPLFIAYYKKNNLAILVCSGIIILYCFKFYGGFLLLLILEYILYGFIHKLFLKKSFIYFIVVFCLIKFLFIILLLFYNREFLNMYFSVFILILVFLLTAVVIISFLKEGENILRIHMISKEIEQDKQIKDTLFRITHEIKNPIAVCKGYLDMFDVENKEHARKYIPIIKNEICKTLILLEDFLSLNRIKIEKDILDVNVLILEVVDSFRLYLKEHKIKLKVDVIDDEVYINGDYNRLREVLVNIIKNSIEAIGKNGLIEIRSFIKEDNIYIRIRDNGIGIKEDILSKIKEPFFTTKVRGTGLGVPLSFEIVREHEGKLIYESKYNEYTLVTIMLPMLKNI